MNRVESRQGNCGLGIGDWGLKHPTSDPKSARSLPAAAGTPQFGRRPRRRGVLLLVVLSMLVLFMLIGTAFMMSSSQSYEGAKSAAKLNSRGNYATDQLDRVLMPFLRDTENPASVIRDHSLLRDFYGTDGFQAVAYKFNIGPPSDPSANDLGPAGQSSRFSGATNADVLGPTKGQFIDIFFKSLSFGVTTANQSDQDPHTAENETLVKAPDSRHVLKLERNINGQPQVHTLPYTKGYYNGCLLTITSGPAAGQSARILDYECVNTALSNVTRLYRLRVMAFGRADGRSLEFDPARSPEIKDLAGASFIVNGRPFNGTGVGYNSLAQVGQARLSALEVLLLEGGAEAVGAELALLPNSRYFNPLRMNIGAYPVPGSPFMPGIPLTAFAKLNDPLAAVPFFNYPAYGGPGDADEGYDAADFQNMWLALQTVTPRTEGRVVATNGTYSVDEFLSNPSAAGAFLRIDMEDVPLPSFHRPDLINFWYHRLYTLLTLPPITMDKADAVRAIMQPYDPVTGQPRPGLTPGQAALIAGIKRKIMMRPTREDHPHFTGSNPQSVAFDYSAVSDFVDPPTEQNITVPIAEIVGPWDVDNDNDGIADSVWLDTGEPVQTLEDGTRYKVLVAPMIVDMDGRLNVNAHGLVNHIDPIQGDGLSDPAPLALALSAAGTAIPWNLAGKFSSNSLPQGVGMGPPEISLRPVFAQPWADAAGTLDDNANRSELATINSNVPTDDYATLLIGRERLDSSAASGRYGFGPTSMGPSDAITSGSNYRYQFNAASATDETATPDMAARLKFFEYPWSILQRSAFGTPPDLMGRYAMGLDYSGQPYYEVLNDAHPIAPGVTPTLDPSATFNPRSLVLDSPYELDLSRARRREGSSAQFASANAAFNESLVQSDDAPFAPADLERVLRAWDSDSATLPSRLWDVVNAFDPEKLMTYDAYRVTGLANQVFNASNQPERMAAAQQIAGINRRLVTTDSAGPPVPSITPPAYLMTVPAKIEYNTSIPNNVKLNYVKAINRRPPGTMAEMLEMRIRREAFKWPVTVSDWPITAFDDFDPNGDHNLDGELNSVDSEYNDPNPTAAQAARLARAGQIDSIVRQLVAPEVLAGKRMDLNRPFGDGRDNDGDGFDNNGNGLIDEVGEPGDPFSRANGVVDEPLEAGEPFLDANGNGKWDGGEPFINLDGSHSGSTPTYTAPLDQLWQGLTVEPIAFDYTNGQAVPVHGGAIPGVVNGGGVRNLDSQARQLYARHLYCLMLLLVDEGYVAPFDEKNDPQITYLLDTADSTYTSQLEALKTALSALTTPPADVPNEARQIVLRKLTCQAIAQWAINCADMRDADAIMTPFEYDEYPWDGWGCPDGNLVNIPIDGDPATDENKAELIDWTRVPRGWDDQDDTAQEFTDRIADDASKVIAPSLAPFTVPIKAPVTVPAVLNQTRGLVWGAERPDLIMTETFAFHDRRTEDLASDITQKNRNEEDLGDPKDNDQRLRPRGSVFIEILNAWSPTGQYPAEIYSKLTRPATGGPADVGLAPSSGIEIGRVSTLGVVNENIKHGRLSNLIDADDQVDATVKRSPLFRVAVVEEHPQFRQKKSNEDSVFDDDGSAVHQNKPLPKRYNDSDFFAAADIDWPEFNTLNVWNATNKLLGEPYVERSFYFTSDNSHRFTHNATPKTNLGTQSSSKRGGNEWFLLVDPAKLKLRLPSVMYRGPIKPANAVGANYFLAAYQVASTGPGVKHRDLEIAPILPGRYALIGTAGSLYTGKEIGESQRFDPNGGGWTGVNRIPSFPWQGAKRHDLPRYITAISRMILGPDSGAFAIANADYSTGDSKHLGAINRTRRIEMLPSPDPELQQVFIARNGGTPIPPELGASNANYVRRDNEVVKLPAFAAFGAADKRFLNIYDGDDDGNDNNGFSGDEIPDARLIPPCVAIPVANMSISEPLDIYESRRDQLYAEEKLLESNAPPGSNPSLKDHYWDPKAAQGDGAFVTVSSTGGVSPSAESPYDTPFDTALELTRNGTTRNYRTLHLQRLADPTLPWNPLPTQADGKANPEYNPNLPVNLYRTIDTASTDLTAFNGASSREPSDQSGVVPRNAWVLPGKNKPGAPKQFSDFFGDAPKETAPGIHRLGFRSLERGLHAAANRAGDPLRLVPRMLWRQEPEMQLGPISDMWSYKPFSDDGLRKTQLQKRSNDLRIRDHLQLDADIKAIGQPATPPAIDADFVDFPDKLKPAVQTLGATAVSHHFDVIFDHSLGFQNEAFGAVATRADIIVQNNLPVAATGTPLPDRGFARSALDPNFPLNTDVASTFPWLAWGNRPFVSANELLNVPATSSSRMLRQYSTINPNEDPSTPLARLNPYDGTAVLGKRLAISMAPFGALLNVFQTAAAPASILTNAGTPVLDAKGQWQFFGAPHYYRILEYVQVPSRFVGTETMFTAEVFNDVPGAADLVTMGGDITGPDDPRYNFQPPFNKVSRERDPGRVNLNTVTSHRNPTTGQVFSEVFDGIMHRTQDGNPSGALAHGGPAWRDVVLSRRGYPDPTTPIPLKSGAPPLVTTDRTPDNVYPNVAGSLLHRDFPTVFSNPFRSPDGGDLVPLSNMIQSGIQVGFQRSHPYAPDDPASPTKSAGWGRDNFDDNGDGVIDDAREAGIRPGPFANDEIVKSADSRIPLFAENASASFMDGNRNSAMMYSPMTRIDNLVTNRSNVFAVWVTIGYFEVEPAPNWNDPDTTKREAIRARFGGTMTDTDAATIAGLALYNRVYPDGYMLGREIGSDTGDVKRPRGFYIVDRTEEVGFKPGEDLNVEKMIKLRRRIE